MPQDELVLTRLEGSEGLSELFEFRIDALSEKSNIDFNSAIGVNCAVSISSYGKTRDINGMLVATQWTGMQHNLYSYRLVLRPWLWMLSRSGGCRMFKDKTVPQIIKEVFDGHGAIAKFSSKLEDSDHPKRKYCVQYRESDLNFVCRLMEEEGIYYYFKHSAEKHELFMTDSRAGHENKLNGEALPYRPVTGRQRRKEEQVFNWFTERTFNTGKIVLKDYDFKEPGNQLLSEKVHGGGYKNAEMEMFDYPGRYKEGKLGDTLAKVRLEAEQGADKHCQATGDAINLVPGYMCKLAEHPEASLNSRYLILRATHTFVSDAYSSTAQLDAEEVYTGHYEFLPADIPYRAPLITPRPVVHGPQTAVVVGEGDIDVDVDGCIMVKFHWDREGKDSRRVRVAQVWSGNKWGGIYIPRVGQEVIVQFVEGDPDRPMVIGTVYNEDNKTPYPLPKEKTISGVKSRSSPSGGYNEFVFDDKAGSELVRLHAEKDMGAVIEHDEKREVKNDQHIDIGNDQKIDVGNTLKITAGTLIELVVGESKITMDGGSITISSPTITVKAGMKLDATSPMTTVKGTATLTLQGGMVLIN